MGTQDLNSKGTDAIADDENDEFLDLNGVPL